MAIQPEDLATADIFDHPSKVKFEEELHLASEHHLVKVQAFIRDPNKAEKKTKGAERVAKHREKLKEAGLVQTPIPAEFAQKIKETGDFNTWLNTQKTETIVEKTVEIIVEKISPAELNDDQKRLIALGDRIEKLTGLKARIIRYLLTV